MEHPTTIAILGYGMLGTVAALLLARYGIPCTVIEVKAVHDVAVAKSGRIDGEAMRILERLGVSASLQSLLFPLQGTQIIDQAGRVLMEFHHPTYPHISPMYGFYQPDVQGVLHRHICRSKDIVLSDEMSVETIETTDTGVHLYAKHIPTDTYHHFSAQYLWVCAGQATSMAEDWGLEWKDYHFSGATLNVDTCSSTAIHTPPYAQTIYNAPLPVTRITNNDLRQRWEFQLEPDDLLRVQTTAAYIGELLRPFAQGDLQVQSAFVHAFDTRILNHWHYHRVFFLGDAAHSMPPYLGLGLSEGIKDAYNLGWKLRARLDGSGTPQLYDSYQQEREPSIKHLIDRSLWVKRLFNTSRLRWLRWIVPILPKRWLRRQLDTATWLRGGMVGHLFGGAGRWIPAFSIQLLGNQTQGLDAVLGEGFALIGWSNPVDVLSACQVAYLAAFQPTFIHLLPAHFAAATLPARYVTYVYDYQSTIQQWMQQHRLKWVLVRPDKIIYDAATDDGQLSRLVASLMVQMPAEVIKGSDADTER